MLYKEKKIRYDGTAKEYECRLLEYTPSRVVLFYEIPENRVVDEVTLPKGIYTIAYYWSDRSYNAYHWVTPEGKTLAYYFNLAENTVIETDRLSWRDMILDVIVYSDGRRKILDEDELPVSLEEFENGKVARSLDGLLESMTDILEELEMRKERMIVAIEVLLGLC